MGTSPNQITQLLHSWSKGDERAIEQLTLRANSLYVKVVDADRRILGAEHQDTLGTTLNLQVQRI